MMKKILKRVVIVLFLLGLMITSLLYHPVPQVMRALEITYKGELSNPRYSKGLRRGYMRYFFDFDTKDFHGKLTKEQVKMTYEVEKVLCDYVRSVDPVAYDEGKVIIFSQFGDPRSIRGMSYECSRHEEVDPDKMTLRGIINYSIHSYADLEGLTDMKMMSYEVRPISLTSLDKLTYLKDISYYPGDPAYIEAAKEYLPNCNIHN